MIGYKFGTVIEYIIINNKNMIVQKIILTIGIIVMSAVVLKGLVIVTKLVISNNKQLN